jgi:gas vesicle protein
MKANKGLLIALATGVAVAGFAALLFSTKEGKKIRKNMKVKGEKLTEHLDELFNDAKEKFVDVKKELTKECSTK